MKMRSLFPSCCMRIPSAFVLLSLVPLIGSASSASWNIDSNGNWNSAGSWDASGIPGDTASTVNTDIATYDITLSANRTVTVDANRNIGGITFGNVSGFNYTLNSGNLLLSTGGVIQSAAGNGDHTDIINSAITIQGDGGSATFTGGASSASSSLRIGAVTGVSTGSNVTTLNLNGTNTGANSIIGIIGNGAGGGKLAVVKSDAGNWLLSGTNTFTGGLTIKQGTVQLGNAAGAGTGTITLGDSSGTAATTLIVATGSATIANNITLGAGGTLALVTNGSNNILFSGGITGSNDLAINNNNVTSGALTISGLINNAGAITVNGTSTQNTLLTGGFGSNVTSVAQNSTSSALTISTNAITVNSVGTTLINNAGRSFSVSSAVAGTGNLILQNNSALASGITVSGAVNHTGSITNSGTGATTPAIIGTTNLGYDKNVLISGAIGSNVTTVTQNSATSILELSSANSFTGGARVFAGTLILSNAAAAGSSQILLGDTSGSTATSLLTRGTLTIANNILVQSGGSGSATIGSATGGASGSGNTPTYTGTITLNKDVIAAPFNNNLTFSGLITGAGGITVANVGPYFSTSGQYYGVGGGNVVISKVGLNNTFTGDIRITSGTLTLNSASSSPTAVDGLLGTGTGAILVGDTSGANSARLLLTVQDNQTLSRDIIVQAGSGGAVGVGMGTSKQAIFASNITFNQSAYLFNTTTSGATIQYTGAITEGSSAIGGTSLTTSGGNVSKLTNTGNNYDGGSVAGGIGTLWGSGAGSLGTGNAVAELGNIRLSDQVALASGKTVYVGPYGGVSIGTNSAAQINYVASVLDSSSQGGVTLGTGISNAIDLASFGNGLMYLGADTSSYIYSAPTLGANTDGNYRLGWGRQTLTVSTGALTGASAKLIVGTPGALTNVSSGLLNNLGAVSLTATNTYGGGTEVNTGSTLYGTQRTVAGESPFGSATGAMTLHSATLQLNNNGTSANGTSVGAFGFDGNSTIQVNGITGGGNTLTVGEITRNNRGVLSIQTSGTGAAFGSTVFLKTSGTAPTTTTAKVTGGIDVQMVAPYFIESLYGSFLSYDSTNGFMPITNGYDTTDFTGLPTNAIVRMTTTAATLNANTTIYALGLVPTANQTLTTNTSGSDKTLTITSGGIYQDGRTGISKSSTIGSTATNAGISFDFAGQEAIINVSSANNSALTIAGNIVNANGLTKLGGAQLVLSSTGSTFVGPITILGSTSNYNMLAISNDLNLGGSGAALNNGVVLEGGKLMFTSNTTMSSTRTLTIGANGGTLTSLNSGNYGASDVTIASKITGSTGGNLTVYSSMTGGSSNTVTSTFAFTNSANDFVAPIFVGNSSGSGVMALLFDTDSQLGNAANTVSLLGGNSVLRYTGSGAISSARAINFFDLGGGVEVSSATGTWTNSGVLAGSGVFNKMGNGQLNLSGSNTYTGNTIVSAGVLNARHADALGATTAAIEGNSGVSGGGVFVQDGAALELQGGIAIAGSGGKTMYLNGSGISSGGALRNVSGDNSNAGAVILQSASTIGVDAGSLTLSGTVSGGALTQTGTGTLVLSGDNTYTGGTTVSFGKLLVNNSTGSGTGSGALSIGASATLGGSGFIGSVTTIAGNLNPGNSPGILTFDNDVTLLAGSSTTIEINGATTRGTDYDGINFNGGLSIEGGSLTFNISTAIADDSVINIFDGTALTSTFSSVVASGTGGYSGSFSLDAGNTSYSATFGTQNLVFDLNAGTLTFTGTGSIPEPASFAALLGVVTLGFVGLRRRRTRHS